jgi:soluble lytic murein transglycosylase-like protein
MLLMCPAALLCVWVSTAHAQIYALREADGTLVLSDKPLGPGSRTFAVPPPVAAGRTTTFGTSGALGPLGTASIGTGALLRATRFDGLIEQHAALHDIRPELVRAVIQVESAFNPGATSNKGAMGLMQLMPGTASDLGVRNPYNPEENIRGGVAYLRQLLDRFGGNEELALAAYNAGPLAVERHGSAVPPYRETRQYVDKIRAKTGVRVIEPQRIYKWVEVVDGREIPRYSNVKPTAGSKYETVVKRQMAVPDADER